MDYEQELRDFCFDVLQDHMEERAYTIEQDRKGNWRVLVLYSGLVYAPMCVVREDWERNTKGTKFENVSLFLPIM